MDSAQTASAIAVGGTLAGVVLGWAGTSLQTRGARRTATARQRDEQVAKVVQAVGQLATEIDLAQALHQAGSDEMIKQVQSIVLPTLYQVNVLCMQLSMYGDAKLKAASLRVYGAAAALAAHLIDDGGKDQRYAEGQDALAQLRDARDLAAAKWWKWVTRRRLRSTLALAEAGGSGDPAVTAGSTAAANA